MTYIQFAIRCIIFTKPIHEEKDHEFEFPET